MSHQLSSPPLGKRIRTLPRLEPRTRAALKELEAWFAEHPESYVAISGGKDSTLCLHLARQVNPEVKVAFFDSGLEFPQTLRYIARLQEHWGFDLRTFHAEPSALQVMVDNGSWEHGALKTNKNYLHDACIERPLAKAQQELGRASIYGLRADESATRLALLAKTKGRVTKHDSKGNLEQSYLAPIWRWSIEEVYGYLERHRVPMNPIYGQLERLGVPEKRRRVGLLIDGWSIDQGRWALARMIAPDLCRVVETHLPALADYR